MSISRLRARADRVNEECDLGELLQEYGYGVVSDRQRTQQFACDIHGVDNKPSARLYGYTNSTFCWVCNEGRDPIAYVIIKEMLNFRGAVEFLEKKLGLPPLPWDDDHERVIKPEDELEEIRKPTQKYEDEKTRMSRFLEGLTSDRDLTPQVLLSFWEVFDRVDYGVARQGWGDAKGIMALDKLRETIMERLKKAS